MIACEYGPRTKDIQVTKSLNKMDFSWGYQDQLRKLEDNWKPLKYGLVSCCMDIFIPLESCNWVENVVYQMLRTLGACFHERKKEREMSLCGASQFGSNLSLVVYLFGICAWLIKPKVNVSQMSSSNFLLEKWYVHDICNGMMFLILW